MPYEPRWDRSLRSLAELTPAAAASSSLATVLMPRSARPYSARRYTGSRATVASGIPPDGPLISGGIALLCIAPVLLRLGSWGRAPGSGSWGLGLPVLAGRVGPASADVIPRYVNSRYTFVHRFTK